MKKMVIIRCISSTLVLVRQGIMLYKLYKGETCVSNATEILQSKDTKSDFESVMSLWDKDADQ